MAEVHRPANGGARNMPTGSGAALAFPVTGYAAGTEKTETETEETAIRQEEKPALEDDFYEAVNYDLLQEWEIPAD